MSKTNLQLLREIPLPDADAIAISPSGKSAVVCQPSSSKISIIDTITGEVLKTVSFSQQPIAVEFSRNGMFLYVVLARDSVVEFFTSDWREAKRIPWDAVWTKIVAGNDNGRAFVISPRGLDELDLAQSEIVRSFEYPGLKSLALNSGNLLCLVTLVTVMVFDVQNWIRTFIGPIESGAVVGIDPEGERAFVGQNGSSNVEVFDLASGDSLGSIPHNSTVTGIALTPSGSLAFVISYLGANMAVYDVSDEVKKIEDVSIGGNPRGVVVSSDGAHVYVTNGSVLKIFEVS
jgi:DNA-binding beta-propeller fold protein YncE